MRLKAGLTQFCGTPSPVEDTLPHKKTQNGEFQMIMSYASECSSFFFKNILFGSLKTGGLSFALSSASFSFLALSGRSEDKQSQCQIIFLQCPEKIEELNVSE